jgi:hypothetical protein
MKAKDHCHYNSEFPEQFTWGWIDSIILGSIAATIVNHIEHDLRLNRNYVPGLRAALNIIADVSEITTVG